MSNSETSRYECSSILLCGWVVQEKDMVLEQYLSLKETNKQLKQQAHHLSFPSYL